MSNKEQIKELAKLIKEEAVYCDLQVHVIDEKTYRKRMKTIINKCEEIILLLNPPKI